MITETNEVGVCSYPSIYTLGHRALGDLFSNDVVVEEKVDGSQISMCRTGCGTLHVRSKGQHIYAGGVPKMFQEAYATAETLQLTPDWVYRGEYLQKPKHNTLAYSRTPVKNIILFDVMIGPELYLSPEEKAAEAGRLGLECVPLYHRGTVASIDDLNPLLERDSVLGGCKIEGFVIKNYDRFGPDKKILIGKFVSKDFQEKHRGEWTKSNPKSGDVIEDLIAQLRTEPRWKKSIQHMREDSKLLDAPQDIGPLIREIGSDLEKEETEFIKSRLFQHFFPQIQRGVIRGFPEFYKQHLADNQKF